MFTDESCFAVHLKKNSLVLRDVLCLHLSPAINRLMYEEAFPYIDAPPWLRQTYRIIIHNHMIPFIYDVHGGTDKSMLQEDRCGPHRAKPIATYLENEDVTRMQWPAQNQDLNQFEKVNGLMKNYLRRRNV